MLNLTPAVCSGRLAAVAMPDGAPAGGEAAPGFAQALDQASVRQGASAEATAASTADHPDNSTGDATGDSEADPKVEARARQARIGGAPRGHGAHGTDPRRALTGPMRGCADAPDAACALPVPATAADAAPTATTDADEAAVSSSQDAAAVSTDLAAWLSSLPLPRPTPSAEPRAEFNRALGALAAARAEAVTTTGNAGAATAHAMQVLGEVAAREAGADAAPGSATTPKPATGRPTDTPTAALLPGASADRTNGVEADAKAGTWQQALAAARDPAATPSDDSTAPTTLATALAASPAATLPRAADGATPLQAEVRAEVGSREFAPALGSQLAVLVRDGIEHARLKLNPAELGPIEVRISVDGGQAQVDFSAAHAHTRQALQEAVPALAGALRDQGLTLTGGGVFEQPRESRGEARQEPTRAGTVGGEPAHDARTGSTNDARAPRARGVVDLYA